MTVPVQQLDPQVLELIIQQLGQLVEAPALADPTPTPLLGAGPVPPASQQSLGQLMGPTAPAVQNPFALAAVPLPELPPAPAADTNGENGRLEDAMAALQTVQGDVPQPPARVQVDPNFRTRGTNFSPLGDTAKVQNQLTGIFGGFQPAALGPSLGQLMALSRGR